MIIIDFQQMFWKQSAQLVGVFISNFLIWSLLKVDQTFRQNFCQTISRIRKLPKSLASNLQQPINCSLKKRLKMSRGVTKRRHSLWNWVVYPASSLFHDWESFTAVETSSFLGKKIYKFYNTTIQRRGGLVEGQNFPRANSSHALTYIFCQLISRIDMDEMIKEFVPFTHSSLAFSTPVLKLHCISLMAGSIPPSPPMRCMFNNWPPVRTLEGRGLTISFMAIHPFFGATAYFDWNPAFF